MKADTEEKKELPNGLNFKQAVLRDQIGASRTGLEKVVNDVKDILYNVGLYDNTPEIESKESTEQRQNQQGNGLTIFNTKSNAQQITNFFSLIKSRK